MRYVNIHMASRVYSQNMCIMLSANSAGYLYLAVHLGSACKRHDFTGLPQDTT